MKLYAITVTAHLDNLETLDVHLDATLELDDASLQTVARSVIPAHLRKVADDIEAGRA